MNITLLLIFGIPLLLVGAFLFWRKRILASRGLRVLVAIGLVPVVLFCGFGYLASFEGSDGTFVAFRVGYAVLGILLGIGAGVLALGRVRAS